MKLRFLGAAREVTGSCYLVETGEVRFLVDCGMFQGGHEAVEKNLSGLNCDPAHLDFVLLTHAHLDHSGLLPLLTLWGYTGPIYTTSATADLLSVMLPDSGFIQERDAERRNRNAGKVVSQPLYTVDQTRATLRQLKPVEYDNEVKPHALVRACFRDAGHILGSAAIEVWLTENNKTTKLVFSGDLGQTGHPLVRDPTPIHEADILLIESTYGNRLHKSMDETLKELAFAINDTFKRKGGNVIVPAFAVGRTQDLLYLLTYLYQKNLIGKMDIYVDSPLATSATTITLKHWKLLDLEAQQLGNWFSASKQQLRIHFVEKVEESIALNRIRHNAVILSASGMCDGGRIKYHLKHNLPRAECTILITGFQAVGTLGRRIVDGNKIVRIFGDETPVKADIYTLGGLSAHADKSALLSWLKNFRTAPRTFVVHGESTTAEGFADTIKQQLGWEHVISPSLHEQFVL